MDQEDKDEELSDEELEHKFDVLWKNWESRRQCEKKTYSKLHKERNAKLMKNGYHE